VPCKTKLFVGCADTDEQSRIRIKKVFSLCCLESTALARRWRICSEVASEDLDAQAHLPNLLVNGLAISGEIAKRLVKCVYKVWYIDRLLMVEQMLDDVRE
jgi:hypothetical protein